MAISRHAPAGDQVAAWIEQRTYQHRAFSDTDALVRRKQALGLTVSALLPARQVAATIGSVLDQIELARTAGLIDDVIVIDADSSDDSAAIAADHGARVFRESGLLPWVGPTMGKGDAMWRGLAVAEGDVVVYVDADTTDFEGHFIAGLLGPLLTVPEVAFVKATYSRPWRGSREVEPDGGGRVTELTAKPLFNLFYPELSGFAQPLAGEIAATRDLLRSIPFFTGYAVEAGMMIDVLQAVGLDAMAQVDLGTRANANQPLFELSKMAYAVLRAVETRLRQEGRLLAAEGTGGRDSYVHAIHSSGGFELERRSVEIVERPPMAEIA